MFNLLIKACNDAWSDCPVTFLRSRVGEYTVDVIRERYKDFNEKTIAELKSLPTLFVTENETAPSKLGYITEINVLSKELRIFFNFPADIPEIAQGKVEELLEMLDLDDYELFRTHWAIKDVNLLQVLTENGILNAGQAKSYSDGLSSESIKPPLADKGASISRSRVFIVHGHDEITKLKMKDFLESLGLQPIILHMQASGGKTIIEKIEEYTDVNYGVVLYTPCDIGAKRDSLNFSRRARQNVVFEHGYLIAKLGRSNVAAMVKGELEPPNDISGVVYISMDNESEWKEALKKELTSAGLS